MPEKLVCPRCNKNSYTAAPESFNPCPYCRLVFNNAESIGSDKRLDPRFYWSSSCELFRTETGDSTTAALAAKIEDISENGIKICHRGDILPAGEMLSIVIKELNMVLPASVVWSKHISEDSTLSGLRASRQSHLQRLTSLRGNAFLTGY